MYTPPHITTLNSRLLPAPPKGWKYANLVDTRGTSGDPEHYPVMLFGPYMYTALSADNNTNSLLIVTWDMERNLVKQWTKPGTRYIWQISFNVNTQTVTFTRQGKSSVTTTLDKLIVGPTIVSLPVSSGPKLPYTLSYAVPSTAKYPIIESGRYWFWPTSYVDGQKAFCVVVVVDNDDVIQGLIDCPGSHNIDKIVVNDSARTIQLIRKDCTVAKFDYNTTLACFTCCYIYTKDDFLFLAQCFNVPLSDTQAIALAKAMPQLDCSLCCRMEGTQPTTESDSWVHVKYNAGTFVVGSLLGGLAGSVGGFFMGGPMGAFVGLTAGYATGATIGVAVPSSSDKGEYQLSSLEQQYSLVRFARFPCGPFDNTGISENVFDSPFLRYSELPYSAAVTRLGSASFPQAYSPAKKAIGDFPRDPHYKAQRLSNNIEVARYIFIIVQADKPASGAPGYQMRINPEDFYPASWAAHQRMNHSQLSEGYRFWVLVGHPHMQVYAAGSLYVDITNKGLLGIDTRTGHYFRSFMGLDQVVYNATAVFLASLGYDTSSMKNSNDMLGYFQENRVIG